MSEICLHGDCTSRNNHGRSRLLLCRDLAGNRLTGPLPVSWASNPKFLNLDTLNLAGNRFAGPLPEVWASNPIFLHLRTLNLSSNSLTGKIPPAWLRAVRWRELVRDLHGNDMHGEVPIPPEQGPW